MKKILMIAVALILVSAFAACGGGNGGSAGEGLTQRQLAERVGKPQSTIARIENGNMNVSYGILSDIAASLGKRLDIRFL